MADILARAVEVALRLVHVRGEDHLAQVLEGEARAGERAGVSR